MATVLENLKKYVQIETTSDSSAEVVPSTETQREFAKVLKGELEALGVKDVIVDDKSFVMAKIPSNIDKKVPTVGFISHLDTAPDASGKNIKPIVHKNYDGGEIVIKEGLKISPANTSDLHLYVGHDIVTSDGTTLLGGDDKAGIAAIMSAVEVIMKNPEIKHGDICIAFTPDEEIGVGGGVFNVEAFGADFAYTLDGETLGEFNYETFTAAEVKVIVNGHNVHPGNAKNKMINACDVASELATMMPALERPEHTEGYEGFFHLCEMSGEVDHMEMIYIIRDFYKDNLEDKKIRFKQIADQVNAKYGAGVIELVITDEYSNMREVLEDKKDIIAYAEEAYRNCDVPFDVKPIRGGTDGSKLSFRGLPCPNIFVGGNNFHSVAEYVSVQAMEKASNIVVEIAKLVGSK
ncbi:MAG: peptidase T [Anaerovoracaceae bacterium]